MLLQTGLLQHRHELRSKPACLPHRLLKAIPDADPLSFAASITALIATTGTVLECLKDLKDDDEQRQRLHDEVTSLWAVLCHLRETIECTSLRTADSGPMSTLHQPGGVLDQCFKVVEELQTRLQPRKNRSH